MLDRKGDLAAIRMPNNRAAFMERLRAVPGAPAVEEEGLLEPLAVPLERLRDALVTEYGESLQRILAREGSDAALVVLSLPPARLAEEERRLGETTGLSVKVIDRIDPGAYESMRRLAEAGLIPMPAGELREVYPAAESEEDREQIGRVLQTRSLAEQAAHKLRAAVLLEAAAALLLNHEAGTDGVALAAVTVLSGDAPETGAQPPCTPCCTM